MSIATVHASAVQVEGRGVLIRGASGSGKSSLALALLFGSPPAALIADDRVVLAVASGRLIASAPAELAGLIEVRGFGIVRRPCVASAAIDLVAELLPAAECPRLPGESEAFAEVAGVALRRIYIAVGAPDAAARVRAAIAEWGA